MTDFGHFLTFLKVAQKGENDYQNTGTRFSHIKGPKSTFSGNSISFILTVVKVPQNALLEPLCEKRVLVSIWIFWPF